MAVSSSNIDHEQLSSSTSVLSTIHIERAQKKIKSYVRILYRRNIHLEPKDFVTLFESGVMDKMMKVLKNKDQKRKRTVDNIQQRKRLRADDIEAKKHGSIEGQLEDSSSSSDDDDDDDYYYDAYLNYVDSDEESDTFSNNPISFTHASTQTDHESI
jgi:hypothetical protein